MAEKKASVAQAKFLARLWSDWRETTDVMVKTWDAKGPYVDATTRACIRYGWLSPKGGEVERNGRTFQPHEVNDKGLDAIEVFLRTTRINRKAALSTAERPADAGSLNAEQREGGK